MTQKRIAFEIESSRLIWYFRIRWCLPLLIVFPLVPLAMLPAVDLNVRDPGVLAVSAVGLLIVICSLVAASLHVRALEYWIEGTTLRINEGILVRKLKSIPLDRVTDLELTQGPLMRLCGIWSLQVQTAGRMQQTPEGIIWGPREPETVRDTIVALRDRAAARASTAT